MSKEDVRRGRIGEEGEDMEEDGSVVEIWRMWWRYGGELHFL